MFSEIQPYELIWCPSVQLVSSLSLGSPLSQVSHVGAYSRPRKPQQELFTSPCATVHHWKATCCFFHSAQRHCISTSSLDHCDSYVLWPFSLGSLGLLVSLGSTVSLDSLGFAGFTSFASFFSFTCLTTFTYFINKIWGSGGAGEL